MNSVPGNGSAWAPLRQPVFRALWFATVVSFVGSFMQDLAAPYLMTTMTKSPVMIAMIPTATSVAVLLLALPAGAIADIVDRRRLLLLAQAWMTAVAALLGVVTLLGWVRPWVLVALTFAMAAGGALNSPAWSAITPELVEMDQLAAAVALYSVAFNLARAVGPALSGLAMDWLGAGNTFLLNAVSFLGVMFVLYRWRRPPTHSVLPAERLWGAMRAGVRYVRYAPSLRGVMWRTAGYILFASALWAMLPLVATVQLGQTAVGYGILLASMGAGALAGAAAMPRLRGVMSMNALIGWGTLLYAAGLLGLGHARVFAIACVAMAVLGAAWLLVLSSLNVAAQACVPSWVRARAMAVYLAVFFAGFAAGSATWGFLAKHIGIPWTFTIASAGLAASMALLWRVRVSDGRMNMEPSRHWELPAGADQIEHDHGPVRVTVAYQVDPARRTEFSQAMGPVRLMRLRDGAIRWDLRSDGPDPQRVVESFVVESWLEHLRQHERVTMADRETQERAWAFHCGAEPPVVSHFIAEMKRS